MVRDSDVVHRGIMGVTMRSMHSGERIVVIFLLTGLFLASSVSALLCTAASGIAVAPANNLSDSVGILRSVGGTIHPGEHRTIQKSVPTGGRTKRSL